MPATSNTHPARHFDTLISPLESSDLPPWLQQASAPDRLRLQEHAVLGRHARREATRAFAELKSLFHFNRAELSKKNSTAITAADLLYAHQTRHEQPTYSTYLQVQLQNDSLRIAKEHAYLATLREEYTIASIKGQVGKQGRQILDWLINAFPTSSPEFKDEGPYVDNGVVICSALQLLGNLVLPDILVFGADAADAPCIAFVPGHPQHPLKQYPSREHFFTRLRRDLLSSDFQCFFARFIRFEHRRQVQARCVGRSALIDLPIATVPLQAGLRSHVQTQMVERLLADACFLAPIDADQAKRLADLDGLYPIAVEQHLMQGAGSGISPGEEDEGRAPSDWLAAMRVVRPDAIGGFHHWLPDLSSYQVDDTDSPTGSANAQGIFEHDERKFIAINGAFYSIAKAQTGSWHILHPSEVGVHLPVLRHNGGGAWHHSFEEPQRWNRRTLLRRLGPVCSGLDDERVLSLARIGGVNNAELRQVYQLDKPCPAILLHLFERARIDDEVAGTMSLIRRGQPVPKVDQVAMLDAFYQAIIDHGEAAQNKAPMARTGDRPAALRRDGDGHCTPVPDDLYLQWFPRLSRAISAHRHEMAQIDTDVAVHNLQRRYPTMPLSVARRFLDMNRELIQGRLQDNTAVLPLPQHLEAGLLADEGRLSNALAGFEAPTAINNDTFILAFRLIEHLDGWQPDTALLLRRTDRFGTPLAQLGTTDVDTTSVYLDEEEGWSTSTATQVLLAQDMTEYGFYRALLYAFGERQRALLGLGLNEPERLHQRLRELALARPTRARLLLGMQVHTGWLRPPLVAAVRRSPAGADDDMFGQEPAALRVQRLLTQYSTDLPLQTADRYINELLRRAQPIGAEVARLEQERRQLDSVLDEWCADLTTAIGNRARGHAAHQILHAWEAQIYNRQDVSIRLDDHAIIELPPLPVTLSAVITLRVMDIRQIGQLGALLQRLPNLRRLELVHLPLTELPEGLTQLQDLRVLNLSRTQLTPASLVPLRNLTTLQTLILNSMDLEDFSWNAREMRRMLSSGSIQTLTLQDSNTRFATGVFAAIGTLPDLMALNLASNQISLTAEDVNDLGELTSLRSLDLSNNPLTRMPNVTRLEYLEELDLATGNAPLTEWPQGLENLPRIRSADLRYHAITSVPQGAGLTPGLRMGSYSLPEAMRLRFEAEMEQVANYANESDASLASSLSESPSEDEAPRDRDNDTMRNAQALLEGMSDEDRALAAQLLDTEQASATEFFSLMLKIAKPGKDPLASAERRTRVQAMIRGAFDSGLRAVLYEESRRAISCEDRDAIVFSDMENLLEADKAQATVDEISAADELIALATSHWRIARLREYLTTQVKGWKDAGQRIDYSEIELYFRIALADRLALRDQPKEQKYVNLTKWVTPAMLDAACDAVRATQNERLPVYLNERRYWQLFLDNHQLPGIVAINRWRDRLGEYLDAAGSDGQLPPQLDASERERLRQLLIDSGRLLVNETLPVTLTLNSREYTNAYSALAAMVEAARLQLTKAMMEPRPGPSSRR
jgi:hypothetical protein